MASTREQIVGSSATKSEKIRALGRLGGLTVREIANAVGVSYQHAYNVLHNPVPASEHATRSSAVPRFVQSWVQVGDGGRLVIPAHFREALGIKSGDNVLLRLEAGELHMLSGHQALRRAQDIVRQFVPEGVSLADELIAERRLEASRE